VTGTAEALTHPAYGRVAPRPRIRRSRCCWPTIRDPDDAEEDATTLGAACVSGSDEVVVVDPGPEPTTTSTIAKLAGCGRIGTGPDHAIAHGDHTDAIEQAGGAL